MSPKPPAEGTAAEVPRTARADLSPGGIGRSCLSLSPAIRREKAARRPLAYLTPVYPEVTRDAPA